MSQEIEVEATSIEMDSQTSVIIDLGWGTLYKPTQLPTDDKDTRSSSSSSVGSSIRSSDISAHVGETKETNQLIDTNARSRTPSMAPPPPHQSMCNTSFKYGHQPWHIFPYAPEFYKKNGGQIKDEIIAGITVAFAQVSESIAFAFIAGVGPLLGLHAAWIIGLSLSFFGSRPGKQEKYITSRNYISSVFSLIIVFRS